MFLFEQRIKNYLKAASVLLRHKGLDRFADILSVGKYSLQLETGYDNWDGGQYFHSLTITVPMTIYEAVIDDLGDCEQKLKDVINRVSSEVKNESLENVSVNLDVDEVDEMIKIRPNAIVKTAFDEYMISEKVGEGGNGRVFAAKNNSGEMVAIKFLERDTSEKRKRFKNEICFCERCHHPNIVRVLDRGCCNIDGKDTIFYVMPLYEESLRERIIRGLSPEEAIEIFIGLLTALAEAHRKDVVHRDVKPENIMFMKGSCSPILCDFGIAHLPVDLKETVVVTKPAERLANYLYAAPEQKRGKNEAVGLQADLYAVGLILNEMFTQQVPSAEGYGKIGDIYPEYGFLDQIFERLFQQDPLKRLYPAERVIEELHARTRISKNERVKNQIREVAINVGNVVARSFQIVGRSYNAPNLQFLFDSQIPDLWLSILQQGAFSHSSIWGCDTNMVLRVDERTLGMPVNINEDEVTIRQKVEYFTDWVATVNAIYKEKLVAQRRQERQRLEEERKHEIVRLENENRIHRLIANM